MLLLGLLAWLANNGDPNPQYLGLMFKARYAAASGDFQTALGLAEKWLRLDPKESEAAFLKVELLSQMIGKKPLKSLELEKKYLIQLRDFDARFPLDYRFPKMLGERLANRPRLVQMPGMKKPDYYLKRTLQLLETEAGNLDSEKADTYYYLGLWNYNQNQHFEASDCFKKVTDLESDASWALYYAGKTSEKSNQLRTALRFYEKYAEITKDPATKSQPIRFNILALRALLNPGEQTNQELVAYLKAFGFEPEIVLNLAHRALRVGLHQQSLELLKVVKPDRRSARYYFILFAAKTSLQQYDDLIQQLQEALGSSPVAWRPQIKSYILDAAMLAGRYQDVLSLKLPVTEDENFALKLASSRAFAAILNNGDERFWLSLVDEFPHHDRVGEWVAMASVYGVKTVALKNRITLFMSYENWPMALAAAEEYLALDPAPADASDDIAVTFYFNGQIERAFETYDQLVSKYPDRHDFLNNYGYFLAETGQQMDRAKVMLEKAVKEGRRNGAYLDSLGWLLFKMGALKSAEKMILEALSVEPR